MKSTHRPATASLPIFWPMAAAATLFEAGSELTARNLRFVAEEEKLHFGQRPALATENRPLLELRTMIFRDYSTAQPQGLPTIVDAPYAGHSAMIADYQPGQSLMQTLREHGVTRLYLTDWRSATEDMKDLEIDQYLAELNVCVDELGGRVNLVGLCQGGWMSAMYAARFPHKVASLVLAGSPIDTDAGDGPIKQMAHTYPLSFYEELVAMGGGLMRGRFHAARLEEHASRPALSGRPRRSLRTSRRPGLSAQARDIRELVREPDRPAGPLVSAGDPADLQGKPARAAPSSRWAARST
jgi:pimeloyl-ACP methyl ester carboxylesterase